MSEITAGTISARITVASRRMPIASPVATIFSSAPGSGGHRDEREEEDQGRARHESPGSPDAADHGASVLPVRSYSSRIRERMNTS